MRLINSETLQLKDVVGQVPPYAILSHTWGPDELSYQSYRDPEERQAHAGYPKVRLLCEQARRDGLGYVWIDTCCIDKSSSAELSEAINSMFRWYGESATCYAYIEDFDLSDDDVGIKMTAKLRACRWFSRGWTLQELIAPKQVHFFGAGWQAIGERSAMKTALAAITGIDEDVLGENPTDIKLISVAKKMSWAAGRETTRVEDIAYCLLGLFDVHMPMLYGEGAKAFVRLQEEILRESEDHSIFCWRAARDRGPAPYRGILADSPDEFRGSQKVVPFPSLRAAGSSLITTTSRGVSLTSTVFWDAAREDRIVAQVGLNCRWGDDFDSVIGIALVSHGGTDQYFRTSPTELMSLPSYGRQETIYVAKSVHLRQVTPIPKLNRQSAIYFSLLPRGSEAKAVYPDGAKYDKQLRLLELGPWVADGKAGLVLECPGVPGRILVLFWVTRDPETRLYTYAFDVKTALPEMAHAWFLAARKPREPGSEHTILHGRQQLVVRGRPGKVQGFDLFCVEVRVEEARLAPSWRARSVYSASRIL
ncbi:hypothetical protein JX265_011037 [Neoarthrinium moseri]|uniref:Heterokaryon incompatibility domain-containing protein n=1 Tax=Neoarthrinium moseri TaxID=1658444 RepID=A0A9P9WDA7_9PEZI|nr:hypothetical protein JX265_011037 [Neoarthrinium moseri]